MKWFLFPGDNLRGETPYFIFRHIWDTTSQRLNSKKGTSSPNPILDLGCKPPSLKYSFRYHERTQLKALILLRENTEQKFKWLQKHISSLISYRFLPASREFRRGRSQDQLTQVSPMLKLWKFYQRGLHFRKKRVWCLDLSSSTPDSEGQADFPPQVFLLCDSGGRVPTSPFHADDIQEKLAGQQPVAIKPIFYFPSSNILMWEEGV